MGLLAVALLACVENENELVVGKDGSVPAPIIRLDPELVDFGSVAAGASGTDSFEIWNDGNVTLEVESVRIDGSAQFTLLTELPLDIAPGSSADVDVVYTPADNRAVGYAHVESNDSLHPTVTATLKGEGLYPLLGVRPVPFDFAALQPECTRTAPLFLANIGGATLVIDDLVMVGGEAFTLAGEFPESVTLEPGQETQVDVVFTPPDIGLYDGALYVTSNEQVGVRTVPLAGEGAVSPNENQETFRQPDGPWDQTDILIYIDQSCSMIDDEATLLANFHVFTENMQAFLADYQIMFVTDDEGCHNLEMITPWTEDATATAESAVSASRGIATEKGFTLAHRAFGQVGAGECNEGFLREDAKTILMMVSDEPEQSRHSWDFYVGEFRAVAPTASVMSIVGDYPSGCESAEAGSGYHEASMATDGDVFSICDSEWDNYFEEIATLASDGPTDTFPLQWIPVVSSIEVFVDEARSSAWSFDASENAVVFDVMPAAGAWIEVNYEVAETCE